jgi:hypothetical protein
MKFQLMFMKEYIENDFSAHNQTGTFFMIREKLGTLSGINYSEDYRNALMLLRTAAMNNEIACTMKEKVWNRVGYWTFFRSIKLSIPNIIKTKVGFDVEWGKLYEGSLGAYISDLCSGDIDIAINRIDVITRSASIEVVSSKKYDLLIEYQKMGDFLRDVAIIISKYKIRPERSVNQNTQYQTRFPFKISCMLCAQPIAAIGQLRCIQHLKPKCGDMLEPEEMKNRRNSIRRMQRIVNNSYINLQLDSNSAPVNKGTRLKGEAKKKLMKNQKNLIKEKGTTKEDAFNKRCELLEGWARHQSIQQSFTREIKIIEECLEVEVIAGKLNLAGFDIYFNAIINIVRKFEHTRVLLTRDKNASFHFDLSLTNISNASRIAQDRITIDTNMSKAELQLLTYMLIREAQFCLIRKASKASSISEIESWNTKYLDINLHFCD